MQVNEYTCH